jgi:PAS domain S-box-containing protein
MVMKESSIVAAALVLSLLLAQPLAAMEPKEAKRILVLYGEGKEHPAHELTDQGLRAAFRSNHLFDVQLYPEYLDDSRFGGAGHARTVADYLRRKYAGIKIEVIITVYPSALELLLSEEGDIFPGVPVVASQLPRIMAENLEHSPLHRFITGVVIGDNSTGLLDSALQLRPGTKQVALVAGVTPNDVGAERIFRNALKPHLENIKMIDLTKLPMQEILARVGSLPPDTIVLFSSVFKDGEGRSFVPREALSLVSRTANAPVFGLYESFLGYGIVGGHLVSFERLARESALMALRILGGESPASIPFGGEQAYAGLYDSRELKRWNIPETAVPPGSEIRYHEPSLWRDYKGTIAGMMAFMTFELVLILGLVMNLRMRRRAERSLLESEERVRLAVSSASAGLWSLDVGTGHVWASNKARELFGFAMDEALDYNSIFMAIHPEDREEVHQTVQHALQTRQEGSVEYRIVLPDGTGRWIASRGRFQQDLSHGSNRLMGVSVDITERKQAAEELRVSEERYRAFIVNSSESIYRFDFDRPIPVNLSENEQVDLIYERCFLAECNETTARLYGFSSVGESIGMRFASVMPRTKPENVELLLAWIRARYRLTNAESVDFDQHGNLRRSSNNLLGIVENGNLLSAWGVSRDITEQKRAEQKIAQQRNELAHVTRISTMSQLASSLAHELNQPLGAILRNAEAGELFLQESSPDLDEVRAILADIRKDEQRAAAVIDRMRACMKRREVERCLLSMNLLAGEVVTLVRSDAEMRRVRVAVETDPAVPPVRGDRVQLEQVLLNLLLNAMDALDDNPPARRLVTVGSRSSGSTVEITVSDTGHGISEDKLLRVFEPFFTSKPNGLGMGLAISRGIIEAHGGRLWTENNETGGATFTFSLPVAKGGDAK